MFRALTGCCAALLLVCLSAEAQEKTGGGPADREGVTSSDKHDLDETRHALPVGRAPAFVFNPKLSFEGYGGPPAPTFKDDAGPAPRDVSGEGFHWKAALKQSALLLAVQHGYAMTQAKTRRELRGPFFKDYIDSLRNLHGWDDGGRFFTNYLAHPLQGATTGFIQIQNDPKGIRQEFDGSGAYWRSRMKALAWAAANSTQFELGPISQAAIGNVGKARKLTYVDLVVTPTLGTALLVSEDALDRYVVRRIESRSDNFYLRIAARMLLNPGRSCANLFRFEKPWHRDTR